MLIEYSLVDHFTGGGGLWLDCYSYQEREFDSVRKVIVSSDIRAEVTQLPPDSNGRIGVRFIIVSEDIPKLENYLKVDFEEYGHLKSSGTSPYRCERVVVLSQQKDCETIYADDDHAANVICSLKAKDKGWFGGLAKPGTCNK
ncbi:MAG: hypothetical protein RLO12_01080 [Fulvivirga sp.]